MILDPRNSLGCLGVGIAPVGLEMVDAVVFLGFNMVNFHELGEMLYMLKSILFLPP